MQSSKIKSSLALAVVSVLLMSSLNVAVAKNDDTHKANPSAYDRDKDGIPDSRDNDDDNDGTPDSRDTDNNSADSKSDSKGTDNDASNNDRDGNEGNDSDGKDGDD